MPGWGDVTVAIQVDRKGYVKNGHPAGFFIPGQMPQEFALRAARQSRFTASEEARPCNPEKLCTVLFRNKYLNLIFTL